MFMTLISRFGVSRGFVVQLMGSSTGPNGHPANVGSVYRLVYAA